MKINNLANKQYKAFFFAMRPSDYTEMARAAHAMKEIGWQCSLFYEVSSDVAEITSKIEIAAQKACKNNQLDYFSFLDSKKSEKKTSIVQNKLPSFWAEHFLHPLKNIFKEAISPLVRDNAGKYFIQNLRSILHQISILRSYFTRLRFYKTFIRRNLPSILVVPEDIVGGMTPLLVRAGHHFGIPTVIIPYTIANQEEAFRSLMYMKNYQADFLPNKISRYLFPRWVRTEGKVSLVRMPISYILGQYFTRTSPPDPWMMNSGYADKIAVENQAMLEYNLRSGLPARRMEITGAIYDDCLAQFVSNKSEGRKQLEQEIGIAADKPLLVIGGCPDQSMSCPAGFEFESMVDFTRYLADRLLPLQEHYEIVLRPHPNYEIMREEFGERGLHVSMIDTARLIALSDGYIAFASATIRWAISCSVPVINYDLFQFDYSDYKNIGGVQNVRYKNEFNELLKHFIPGDPAFTEQQNLIRDNAPNWGMLDGKSCERISALMVRLIEARGHNEDWREL